MSLQGIFNKNVVRRGESKRNDVFGTVILVPPGANNRTNYDPQLGTRIGFDKCPHILLAASYDNGRFKVPGGKSEGDEDIVAAMNREFVEETGNQLWKFTAEDRLFEFETSNRRTCHYFLKIIHLNDTEMAQENPILWRPSSRPHHLGESAGIVWMPLCDNAREFPYNMTSSVFELGGPPQTRYIGHAIIWEFCKYLATQVEGISFEDRPLGFEFDRTQFVY